MSGHHIVLVPGFFGFTNFGKLVYFQHVADIVTEKLEGAGHQVSVTCAKVPPTDSLRKRSALVAAHIREVTTEDAKVTLIGHSSGGLDARMVVSPQIDLATEFELEPIARRIETVVSIASPHQGTPLAQLFVGLLGQKMLRLISLVTLELLQEVSIPIGVLAKMGAVFARHQLPGGKTEALLDHLHSELLGILPEDQRSPVGSFFEDVYGDQSLLAQIAPACADLINASATEREGVRYGSVVVAAPTPGIRTQLSLPKTAPVQSGYMLYRWLHRASTDGSQAFAPLTKEQRAALRSGLGKVPNNLVSDGIVPALSQVHGEVVWSGAGDHLDIIGHFNGKRLTPPHHDWLMTGAAFSGEDFESAWGAVTDFILG